MKTGAVIASSALFVFAVCAHAQNPGDRPLPAQTAPAVKAPIGKGKPPGLQPLPEPPPPPPGMEPDPALEPEVTIRRRGKETIEEFRIQGRLYMIKVTPAHGVPYYLIDENGRGDFTRRDSYDTGTRPPMWVIHQF
jgi:hypothetical protein